ncbi:MAG TPA: hypothetical protein VEP90_26750, partial [Methylomirabilota bacterium]|nr:hypothetical protein [Methylomirabilota bacterium]
MTEKANAKAGHKRISTQPVFISIIVHRYKQLVRQSYRGGNTQSANIHLISKSSNAINRILVEDRHPYWTFNWTVSGELDISSLVSIIENAQDRTPISSSAHGTKITSTIRADVSTGASQTTNITLV